LTIARRAVEAAPEGGFFRFGGVWVSGSETRALQEVVQALGDASTG
jgi:hypothetical protein